MKNLFNFNQLKLRPDSVSLASRIRVLTKYVATLALFLCLGVGQMWAGDNCDFLHKEADDVWIKYVTDAGTTQQNLDDDSQSDIDLGSLTNLSISEFRAITKKHDGNVCHVKMYYGINTSRDGDKNSNVQAGYNNDGYGDWYWGDNNWWTCQQFKNTSVGIDLIRNRLPGDYYFDFCFAINGNSGGSTGCYDDQKWWSNNGGNYHISYTIPDPTITITGASSLVAGTSTNIQATITNYPVGATLTRVDVSGNIASSKYNTGTGSSVTVSSCTPNASGANGITVTVTVTFGSAGTKTYTYKYNVLPPAVSDFTITPSGSGYLSSGSGTSGSPYLVAYNSTITFGLSGATKAYADGNSSPQYSTDGGSNYGTTGTYISKDCSTTYSTKQNYVFKARLKNNTTSSLVGSVKEKTVYYQVPTYAITLHDNNGGSQNGSATAWYGRNALTEKTAPTKTGYDVSGYYTNDATPVLIADANGNLQASTAYTDASNKWNMMSGATLYAHWTAHTYTITLDKGTGGTAGGTATVDYDATTLKTISHATKTGYTLTGYYTSSSGGYKVLNADGTFVSTNANISAYIGTGDKWVKAVNCTLYAQWSENMTSVTLSASPTGKGTFKVGGAAASSTTVGVTTTRSVQAVAGAGYHLTGTIWSKNNDYITLSSTTASTITVSGTGTTGNATNLQATFTPNTYSVSFNKNNGTGDNMSNQAFTYDVAQNLTANTYTRTGYTFDGWATSAGGAKAYDDEESVSNLSSTNGATFPLYAHWTAKSYTVTLDVDEDNQGDIEGATTSQSVTYDATPSTIANRPTAANGYALVGYYTDQNGEGLKVINGDGTWIASVTGYTDGSGNWKRDDDATLYAYYKKAEITNLVLSPTAVPNDGTTITATPTISPAPEGTTKICWELQYSNGTAHASQPVFTPGSGNAVTFPAPTASGIYRVQATLRTGSSCEGGEVLDTRYATFQVAGEHEVTVRYQDADGRTIKASTTITAQPLNWTDNFSAPDIPGYTFTKWVQGEGVTIDGADGNGEKTTSTIRIKATYAGTLTAVYAKKDVIYFNNTVGWEHVYVYFYSSNKYWDETTYGSGAQYDKPFKNGDDNNHKPFYRHFWGEMTQIEGTNVWYFDYQAAAATIDPSNASEINGYTNVAFTEAPQGYGYGTEGKGYEWFHNTKAAMRGDFDHDLPMYVPLTTTSVTKNGTDYYNKGYWMNYPENTGYTLKFYSISGADKVSGASDSIVFPFSADKAMPLKLDVEFNEGGDRYFMIKRNDGNHYGKNYVIKQGFNDEQEITVVNNKLQLIPSAKGIYTFTLTYHDDNFYIDVDYPIAVNDYRIKYSDNAAWSGGTHGAGWYHPSDVINKIGNDATKAKTDIVSMYIAKGAGITPSMKFQYASNITDAGVITWSDVASGTINLSSFSSDITKAGVYNIYVSQPVGGGSITVDSIKPYTGNYYIRTDCAGSTKWDGYKALDHHMTYSEYTKNKWDYTHYYCHWVKGGTNVKFTIANDYSVSISDSLIADYGTTIANIDGSGFLASGSSNNANIRFMWNEATNKLSRAYIRGSGSITDRFLVLEGDAKMFDAAGNALTGDYQDHDKWGNKLGTDNQVIMHDDENFVYERTIKVQTTARARLSADYNSHTQYFIGSSGAFANGTTVELLGGSASATKYDMRIVYDFKTNRLVTAYVPSDTVKSSLAINADLMLVREHQEDGKQLVFKGEGAGLSNVHTVYGVMRFNRWTLNNKSTADGHAPLGDPKSGYERGLYWISFPFDVNLSDVFGFGTYGVDWIIMEYDGAARAEKGYWMDSDSFWKYVTNRTGKVLEKGKGYVLALDLDRMKSDNTEFWANNIEQVELFFPSATNTIGSISATNVTTTVESHECTINRHTQAEKDAGTDTDINKNRTKADSHWNMIGVPSYANYGTELTSDGSTIITWNSTPGAKTDLPFLYEWNMMDNTYTVQSGTTYPFKAMHAYMVQYAGELHWSLASATPVTPIVARRTYAEQPQNTEFRLELQQNEKTIDQTFVKLSDDENVSANFNFDEDLCKEYNGTKANIYTFIEGYIPAAGNTLPMSEQTTIVPVGVQIKNAGDYTFAIPEGTEGIGVVLVDNVANTRTNLGLTDYTVTLSTGTIDGRFVLEISPISQNPTDVELINGENGANGVRKVIIDQKMYIIKGDRIYDATGALVK